MSLWCWLLLAEAEIRSTSLLRVPEEKKLSAPSVVLLLTYIGLLTAARTAALISPARLGVGIWNQAAQEICGGLLGVMFNIAPQEASSGFTLRRGRCWPFLQREII